VQVTALQDELRAAHERLAEAERVRDAARADRSRATAASERASRRADRAHEAVTDLQTRLESGSRHS
jgi:uncharacterized coiled-coil DUF342 family protein